MEQPLYSIVIPVYGSAESLRKLHSGVSEVMKAITSDYEFIFVDDCSPDEAWSVLEDLARTDPRVTAVQLMRNVGQGAATLCGLGKAKGELIITMDDDLQHPPDEIPKLVEALHANPRLDAVMGEPLEKRHNAIRRLGSRLVHELNSALLGKDRNIHFTSFRILRRNVVDVLLTLRTMHPALGPMINSVTKNIGNVTVRHDRRKAGKSGYTLSRIMRQLAGNLIGYSMLPLHLVGVVGIVGILTSIGLGLAILVRYLAGGILVPGWTTIVLLLVILSGVTFLSLAVLGEYLLKILQLANASPQYVIRSVQRHSAPIEVARAPEAAANLNDGVVYLRELERSDLDRTLDWMNRSDIRTAIRIRGPVTRGSQEVWFERLQKSRDRIVYAICLTENNRHVGNVSLDHIEPGDRNARFSIFVADQETRGRGIGSRAMRLLMLDAFHNRGLAKIWCKTTAGNQEVLDFYAKLGFRIEGTLRRHECIDGEFVDKILLGLLSTEWQGGSSTR